MSLSITKIDNCFFVTLRYEDGGMVTWKIDEPSIDDLNALINEYQPKTFTYLNKAVY